jgi:hypothetical protein
MEDKTQARLVYSSKHQNTDFDLSSHLKKKVRFSRIHVQNNDFSRITLH